MVKSNIKKTAKKLKIVCLGGGNLMPKAVLAPLKKYPVQLTGITSMVDSGGSTGQFRRHFGVLPPGDIRRHILALSNAPQWKKDLWAFRFGDEIFEDGHRGQVFANAFIAGLEIAFNDYRKVIAYAADFMELEDNRALPMTIEKAHLFARLENGEIIEGEAEIEVPVKHDSNLKIEKVFLKPAVKMFGDAKKAILAADLIIIGPGDLYSSIAPCFIADGAPAVFKKAKGKKMLVSNTVARLGETQGFSMLGFADEVEKYMGCALDYVLYHNRPIDKKILGAYRKKHPEIGDILAIGDDLDKNKFIGKDILKVDEFAYDPKKIVSSIFKIINLK